jgi:hypothetical protein
MNPAITTAVALAAISASVTSSDNAATQFADPIEAPATPLPHHHQAGLSRNV